MAKSKLNVGAISFIGLTGLAILSGVGMPSQLASVSLALMGIFGIIAGMVNIKTKEVVPFLVSLLALIVGGTGVAIISAFDIISMGAIFTAIVSNLAIAYSVMAVVVAIKTIISVGKN